jgi:hypothetical protein
LALFIAYPNSSLVDRVKKMKTSLVLFAVLSLALTGCESISDVTDSVREKFATRDESKVRVFAAEQRATYEAARVAVDQLDFRFVRGGPAQGELEAISKLEAGDSLETTRQITMKVRLNAAPLPATGTEVRVWLKEIIEADASKAEGQGVGSPLRDTALYDAFFRNLQQALDSPKK